MTAAGLARDLLAGDRFARNLGNAAAARVAADLLGTAPDGVQVDWSYLLSCASVLALSPKPEFLLLGTGATLEHPPRAFVAALEARGMGVEVMDSRVAARAWGVLRAEERQIVAALLPL